MLPADLRACIHTHTQVTFIEEVRRPSSAGAPLRSAAVNRMHMSPTASNGPISPMRSTSDFPLRLDHTIYLSIYLFNLYL